MEWLQQALCPHSPLLPLAGASVAGLVCPLGFRSSAALAPGTHMWQEGHWGPALALRELAGEPLSYLSPSSQTRVRGVCGSWSLRGRPPPPGVEVPALTVGTQLHLQVTDLLSCGDNALQVFPKLPLALRSPGAACSHSHPAQDPARNARGPWRRPVVVSAQLPARHAEVLKGALHLGPRHWAGEGRGHCRGWEGGQRAGALPSLSPAFPPPPRGPGKESCRRLGENTAQGLPTRARPGSPPACVPLAGGGPNSTAPSSAISTLSRHRQAATQHASGEAACGLLGAGSPSLTQARQEMALRS